MILYSRLPVRGAIFIFLLFQNLIGVQAQTTLPTKCLEIESILVDACVSGSGCSSAASPACSCEGKNEMVRFRVGPNALQLSGITIDWPNNNFLGLVQNATTAALTATLNATIQSCGYLVEPPGGVLPAGSQVLLISSTDMCTSSNSFATLSDTLYLIFQQAGNYQGHFANTNNTATVSSTPSGPSSLRTLIMGYTPGFCEDTATYDRPQLVNTLGSYGGSSLQNDGATVSFSWPGVPVATYSNLGCQAPFVPLSILSTSGSGSYCTPVTINLNALLTGNPASVYWSGGTGVFSSPLTTATTYTPGSNETGAVALTFHAISNCGDTLTSAVNITLLAVPQATITTSGPLTFCSGDTLLLTAGGGGNYNWNTSATASSISVTTSGTYWVTVSNVCGSDTQAVTVSVSPAAVVQLTASGPTSFCSGDSVLLTASGNGSYLWNTGDTTASIVVTASGTYSVILFSACANDTAVQVVLVSPPPAAAITANGPLTFCSGDSVQLTAGGNGNFLWSTGDTSAVIFATAAGNYVLTAANSCGAVSDSVVVAVLPSPSVAVLASGSTVLCGNDSVVLTATSTGTLVWSTGATTSSITATTTGTYFVVASNSCGIDSASIVVTAAPLPVAAISGPVQFCQGDTITLTGSGGAAYVWSTGANSSAIAVSAPGVYSLVATNACGSDTTQLNVISSSVNALFTMDTTTGLAPLVVNFTNGSSANATSWQWDFGSSGTSVAANPSFTFTAAGTYIVTLTVTNANGCTDVYTQVVLVTVDPSSLSIPNVFTPNADGNNDVFMITSTGIREMNVSIYDRWGILIGELTQPQQGWDGRTTSGQEATDGTYYYVLRATGVDEKVFERSGFFMLIR